MLADEIDLVSDKAVRLAVHCVGGLGIRRLDEAEDLARQLVDPVAQLVDPVRTLCGKICLVGGSYIGRRHTSVDVMNVHEKWHIIAFLVLARR